MFLPRPLQRTRQMVFCLLLALLAGPPASAIEMRTGNLVVADRSADDRPVIPMPTGIISIAFQRIPGDKAVSNVSLQWRYHHHEAGR